MVHPQEKFLPRDDCGCTDANNRPRRMRRGRVSLSRQGKRRGTEAKEPQRSFGRRSRKPPSKGGNVGNKLPPLRLLCLPAFVLWATMRRACAKKKAPCGALFVWARVRLLAPAAKNAADDGDDYAKHAPKGKQNV